MNLKKKHIDALGKLFGNEIGGKFPFQSRAKVYKELEEDGYCEFVKVTIPPDRQCPFPMTVNGWALTIRGHLTYCESCKDVEDED